MEYSVQLFNRLWDQNLTSFAMPESSIAQRSRSLCAGRARVASRKKIFMVTSRTIALHTESKILTSTSAFNSWAKRNFLRCSKNWRSPTLHWPKLRFRYSVHLLPRHHSPFCCRPGLAISACSGRATDNRVRLLPPPNPPLYVIKIAKSIAHQNPGWPPIAPPMFNA